jgi:signal peptidase I
VSVEETQVEESAREGGLEEEDAARSGSSAIAEQLLTLVVAVLIALGIRAFVIEPFRIPSGSMFPTLLIGDHLFVNKFAYGIKIPFTDLRLPGYRGPERGDVVVFTVAKKGHQTFPADRRPDLPREEFVKRVIGVPGDRIEWRDGSLLVNGEQVDTRPVDETFTDDFGQTLDVEEVSLDDHHFRILDDPHMNLPVPQPLTVQEGRYYMLGDNRDHSKDSRVWGTVRLAEMKGPAFLLYWSWSFNGGWLELLKPGTWSDVELRWDRVGSAVQ